MEKSDVLKALKACKEKGKKRNFKQNYDFVLNLKNINIKKTENQKEFFITLPHATRKKKICALVSGELKEEAENNCDKVVLSDDFPNYAKDKKSVKKLTEEYDYFIAQANIMGQIATNFGRVFGPRGKMPNPKAGCVVPPKAALKPVYEKLQKTVKAEWKKNLVLQVLIGTEDMSDDDIVENVMFYYNSVLHQLPSDINNIKSMFIKLTMGGSVKL